MNATCIDIATKVLGAPTRKQGQELLFRCPQHDDRSPSLQVNESKNVFLCGPCGK